MKRLICAALLVLGLGGCDGEKAPQAQIRVTGEVTLEKRAEIFYLGSEISERGKDRDEVLARASTKLDSVKEGLSQLNGLESFKFKSSKAVTDTVRPNGCDTDRYSREPAYPDNCDPIEYIVRVNFVVEGQPAIAGGSALSLMNELGLEESGLELYGVVDEEAARNEVRQAALARAMAEARGLAEQAGATLGRPVIISYGGELISADIYELGDDRERIVVTGSRLSKNNFNLPTPVVTFQEEVTAVFALEKAPKTKE